eukprot:CAMPEP_0202889176 /NCGR_PEP_ID=MMETSP1391-20130828/43571_1 /ASSEMBLY_ACC=CAM_ASM_000867 /TAXON_ID=1034604 /ORGANISM="Chlamydomonas leiostraca, Strain SAG 11-49" /LENGTH=169 /DNA_ID=CAMNT_0049572497 /DNA_START=440 /DNA_END=947 /DNA_ORIENTATION=-
MPDLPLVAAYARGVVRAGSAPVLRATSSSLGDPCLAANMSATSGLPPAASIAATIPSLAGFCMAADPVAHADHAPAASSCCTMSASASTMGRAGHGGKAQPGGVCNAGVETLQARHQVLAMAIKGRDIVSQARYYGLDVSALHPRPTPRHVPAQAAAQQQAEHWHHTLP